MFLRLHSLRLMLLEQLLQHFGELREVGGVRAIPFMQVCTGFLFFLFLKLCFNTSSIQYK